MEFSRQYALALVVLLCVVLFGVVLYLISQNQIDLTFGFLLLVLSAAGGLGATVGVGYIAEGKNK